MNMPQSASAAEKDLESSGGNITVENEETSSEDFAVTAMSMHLDLKTKKLESATIEWIEKQIERRDKQTLKGQAYSLVDFIIYFKLFQLHFYDSKVTFSL